MRRKNNTTSNTTRIPSSENIERFVEIKVQIAVEMTTHKSMQFLRRTNITRDRLSKRKLKTPIEPFSAVDEDSETRATPPFVSRVILLSEKQ
jgi:hypothetical protein